MKIMRSLFMVLGSLLVLTTTLHAQPFRNDAEAYDFGYEQGYRLGMDDHDVGLGFNYRHSSESGINYYTYVNANFRSGFIEGYSDGYYSRPTRSVQPRAESRGESYYRRDMDTVTAFSGSGYTGSMRTFGIGRYAFLDGRWNNSIASVQMNGPVRVILFDEPDFQGERLILESNSADLGDLNFSYRAASMIVEPSR